MNQTERHLLSGHSPPKLTWVNTVFERSLQIKTLTFTTLTRQLRWAKVESERTEREEMIRWIILARGQFASEPLRRNEKASQWSEAFWVKGLFHDPSFQSSQSRKQMLCIFNLPSLAFTEINFLHAHSKGRYSLSSHCGVGGIRTLVQIRKP